MATTVPHVSNLDELAVSWVTALRTAMDEFNAIPKSRAAISFTASWGNYGSGWTEPCVTKWGKVVVLNGLAKNISGASITPGASIQIGTVPAGYRPRVVGAASPLGGRLLIPGYVGSTTGSYRIDVLDSGTIYLYAGAAAVAANGYVGLGSVWVTD